MDPSVLGMVVLLASSACSTPRWARIVDILLAGVIAVAGSMGWPTPGLAVVIIATCGLVIWALGWHGRDIASA